MKPREALVEHLLELAWQQWTLLGVRGTVAYRVDAAIGLEELIVLTAVLADEDPRLRDESVDWCRQFGHFVSKPKLKASLKASSSSVKHAFAPFGEALDTSPDAGWPAASASPAVAGKPYKASAPDLELAALIGLRLRALFGVGSRADVLCAVLPWSTQTFTASDLVFIGYTKRSVAQTLESLAAGGLLRSSYVGNRRVFSWRSRPAFQKLVGPLPASYPRWGSIFRTFEALLTLFTRVAGKSPRLAGVEAAKVLQAYAFDLEELGFVPPKSGSPEVTWNALVEWTLAEAEGLVTRPCAQ